jgi:uncharacterized protein (TIGR03905 family)
MRKQTYRPQGTCCKQIDFVLTQDNRVEEIKFQGGCAGNTEGISRLVKGMAASQVIETLEGTQCGGRGTSCPDQLAQALKEALANKATA